MMKYCQSPTNLPAVGHWRECIHHWKQTTLGWPEGPMSSNGSSEHQIWPVWHWRHGAYFSKMRAGSLWAHLTDVKGSGEAVVNVMLHVTLFSIISLVVGLCLSRGAYPWMDSRTMMHNNIWPLVKRVCRQFLEGEEIDLLFLTHYPFFIIITVGFSFTIKIWCVSFTTQFSMNSTWILFGEKLTTL